MNDDVPLNLLVCMLSIYFLNFVELFPSLKSVEF